MDPSLWFLIVPLYSLMISFGLAVLWLRAKLRRIRTDALNLVRDSLFVDTIIDGKRMKTPNPEVVAMAGSMVDAMMPVVVPRAVAWLKTNVKITGTGGDGGPMDLDPSRMIGLLPKKMQGIAGLLFPLVRPMLAKMGAGGAAAGKIVDGGAMPKNPFMPG